jgi:hypothetical protein
MRAIAMFIRSVGFWVLFASLSVFGIGEASARPRQSRDPIEVHRAAARALLAAGDLDGAWLELSAAYQQSCDAQIAERSPVASYPKMGDALLPVPTLLSLRHEGPVANISDDRLVPFHVVFRVLDEAEDLLVPIDRIFRR